MLSVVLQNVRYLTKFIGETGNIIARKEVTLLEFERLISKQERHFYGFSTRFEI